MYYVYDDSFYGLLTAIFLQYAHKNKAADIRSEKHFKNCTFFDVIEVKTSNEFAERVLNSCSEKISPDFVSELYILFLSDISETAIIIRDYIDAGLKCGKFVSNYLNIASVNRAVKLKKRILSENHRLKGLLRFRLIDSFYVADIEPDFNILPIFYQHFERRLANENWIIRDTKRKIAVLHINGATDFQSYDDEIIPDIKDDEYEKAWKIFYDTIAISERKNPTLRQQFMPKKYWKNIVELK